MLFSVYFIFKDWREKKGKLVSVYRLLRISCDGMLLSRLIEIKLEFSGGARNGRCRGNETV